MEEQKVSDSEIDKFINKWRDCTPEQQKKSIESNVYFFPQLIKAMGPTNTRIEDIWASTTIDVQNKKIIEMTELLKQNSATLLSVWEQTHETVKDEKMVEVISSFGNDSSMVVELWKRVPASLQLKEMRAIMSSEMPNSVKMTLVKNSPISVQREAVRNAPGLTEAYGITAESVSMYPIQTGQTVLNTVEDAKKFVKEATEEQRAQLFNDNPDMVADIFRSSNLKETEEIFKNMSDEELENYTPQIVEGMIEQFGRLVEEENFNDAEELKEYIIKTINNPKLSYEKSVEVFRILKTNNSELFAQVMTKNCIDIMQEQAYIQTDGNKFNIANPVIDKFIEERLTDDELKKLGYSERDVKSDLFEKLQSNQELMEKFINSEEAEELILNLPDMFKNWDAIYETILLERIYQEGKLGGEKIKITAQECLKVWQKMSKREFSSIENNSEGLKFQKDIDYSKVNPDLIMEIMAEMNKTKNKEVKNEGSFKRNQAKIWAIINGHNKVKIAKAYGINLDELSEQKAREKVMKKYSANDEIDESKIEEEIERMKIDRTF